MSDTPQRSSSSRPLLPNLLVGALILVVVAAVLVASFTIDPAPRHAKAPGAFTPRPPSTGQASATATTPAPAFADDLSLPPADAPAGPTSSDVAAADQGSADDSPPADWKTLPIDKLRARANANQGPAMEELARRLFDGNGIAPDPPAAAGWMMRAAELGSPQAEFSVGVMYERGVVVERNSTRAAQWYGRAADTGLAVAKHNLALLLREGKGVPRNGARAIELLRSAARQGMAASMFSLGDIYEQGDAAPKDLAAALAWFAITEELERQVNHGTETTLMKTAAQRVQSLKRTLTPAELQRAEELGQKEFHQIVLALATHKQATPKPQPAQAAPAAAGTPPATAASQPAEDRSGWPKDTAGQVRAIQQLLVELKLLHDKPDGLLGPMTRNALREFQRRAGLAASGEPSKEIYLALREKLAAQATAKGWSLPPPQSAAAANKTPPAPATIDLGKTEPPPPPPSSAEIARSSPKPAPVEPTVEPVIELAKNEPPAPPTSAEIAATPPLLPPKPIDPPPPPLKVDVSKPAALAPPATLPDKPRTASIEPPKAVTPAGTWPKNLLDQTKAIQQLLGELRFFHGTPTGRVDAATRTAIREYQRMAGLKETGEPSKALFESLKEMRAMMAPKQD